MRLGFAALVTMAAGGAVFGCPGEPRPVGNQPVVDAGVAEAGGGSGGTGGGVTGTCGDGVCEDGESPSGCPGDCSTDPFFTCENEVCQAHETVTSCPWDCQPPDPGPVLLPHARLSPSTGNAVTFDLNGDLCVQDGTAWHCSHAIADGTFAYLGDGQWQLELSPHVPLDAVSFPWRTEPYQVHGDIADDVVFHTYLGGVFQRAQPYDGSSWDWWGLVYPGTNFAPLLIVADHDRALLLAATQWPPRSATVMQTAQKLRIHHPGPFVADHPVSRRIVLWEVEGSQAAGYEPWQLAMRRYQRWLELHLGPTSHPEWMWRGEGILARGLQNGFEFDVAALRTLWDQWGAHFGWLSFWGQMSNYAGPPELAVPPLQPGEAVGCCLHRWEMHPRYREPFQPPGQDLLTFVHELTAPAEGDPYHVSYYTREPPEDVGEGCFATDDGAAYLHDWMALNEASYHANAHYIDVIGRRYQGDPALAWSRFSDGTIGSDVFIEGFVDVYPVASLLSGFIEGGSWEGGPGIAPWVSERGTFINLARFLMGDRLGYLGTVNSEAVNYGWDASPPHWLERQIFLLGAKAIITHPNQQWLDYQTANDHLLETKLRHEQVDWWARRPKYLDTAGLTEVPASMEARRFLTQDGTHLIAVDNPAEIADAVLRLKGRAFAIPADRLGVIEIVPSEQPLE